MRSSARIAWRDVDGILLLDKPQGLSSNQALQKARHLFRAEKGGHTGSLDPLATGLLPLCFGEATKIAGLLLGSRKAYDTECLLGVTTTTDDAEGEPVLQRPVPAIDGTEIRAALKRLTGRIRQVPPVYSALKQGGEPLYRRARRGEEVEVPSREVDVSRFELLDRAGDRGFDGQLPHHHPPRDARARPRAVFAPDPQRHRRVTPRLLRRWHFEDFEADGDLEVSFERDPGAQADLRARPFVARGQRDPQPGRLEAHTGVRVRSY